jgi:hypothetical protein
LIEPGFTRTRIERNRRFVQQPLAAHANERNAVLAANPVNIAGGEDPTAVAAVILEAMTSHPPKLRYLAGRQARLANRLRKFTPAGLFDRGLRKQFGLMGV